MLSAEDGAAGLQAASFARAASGGRTATKEELALRKKKERAHTTALWARLELLAPNVDENKGEPGGGRSKALRGRAKEELLKDVVHAVRLVQATAPGALAQAYTTLAGAPGALEQAHTTQAGAGLIAIELESGKIAHQSPSFVNLMGWIPVDEARGNIHVSLESGDGDAFHSFCQSVVMDAGDLCGETFLASDKVVGRSITVRFFTRAPGPPGLRNPAWLLMLRAVKLTLVGVQPWQLAGESPAAGRGLFERGRVPEAIGVFTADLSGGMPQQWTLQVAHVRYLLDFGAAPGTYDMETGNMKPLEQIATLFNLEFSKEEGASVFSRAAAQLEYAAASALSIAQRSASWLTRKALRISHQWLMRLNDDDTVMVSTMIFFTLFGGVSTSVSNGGLTGEAQFTHRGLEFFFFVADPEQPLDRNLRAMSVRIASAKTAGEFGRCRPFVISFTWGDGIFKIVCKMLSLDTVGKKMPSVEDMSELLEKLKVSPGAGLLSDGSASICVGQSDVKRDCAHNR